MWLFMFKTKISYQFPQWFNRWWAYFGPCPKIYHPVVKTSYDYFENRINLEKDAFPADLHFFSKFSLAWVFKWTFKYESSGLKNSAPILQRILSVKWWQKFANVNNVSILSIES